jgi:hypothetical protein
MKGRSMEEQGSLPMLTRGAASFVPTSINEADRTVDLVWSTGADVRRQGLFSGPFVERLDMSDEAVDLSRLNNGANLLDSHNASGGIRNVLGVVVDGTAEVKGPKGRRQGRATVRFSNRADVEPVWNDVKAGILRNISVGYSVEDWQRVEPARRRPRPDPRHDRQALDAPGNLPGLRPRRRRRPGPLRRSRVPLRHPPDGGRPARRPPPLPSNRRGA